MIKLILEHRYLTVLAGSTALAKLVTIDSDNSRREPPFN